jgi:aldehyde dehydrogenase (NAD+)
VLAKIGQAGSEDIDAAVTAARQALGPWQALSGEGRARHLYALARQVQKHARMLSVIETLDNGKPIRETRDIDIPLVARHFYHHAGWASLVEEELPDSVPLGVVGQVIPWNFPLLMLAWKVAPALAAGNTVVLKPAEYTSLSALYFARMSRDAGLPSGVLNILTGDGETGRELVSHPDIDKVAFTGSTSVGREIRETTAGSGKALTLELGGKSPFIVFADADLDSAVEGVVDAIWLNQGEVCCAGSRLLVQEPIAQDFLSRLKIRMQSLRLGDPLDKAIDMGAIVNKRQFDTIRGYVEGATREGASCWQADAALPDQGWYFPPTLVTDVAPAHTIATEEVFGPVLAAMTFRTHNEAIEIANNTRYGLAASVWSENINLALEIASKIKAGVVWVNCTNEFDAAIGFGGYRESGFGREGGIEGLWAYRSSAMELPPDDLPPAGLAVPQTPPADDTLDRTAKLYIGGCQVRPDGGYSRPIAAVNNSLAGDVGEGNRKDIRNAVEAAHAAASWGRGSAHGRAQVLYFLAENLEARADEFAQRIRALTGTDGEHEVRVAITRLLYYAGWCDKFEGVVHHAPAGRIVFAMPEPIGVMGLVCPQSYSLLGLVSMMAPAIAVGNTTVVIPSEEASLVATDLYQVLDTSDVPAGVVNVITGSRPELAKELARHDNVDGLWCAGHHEMTAEIERLSSGNLKQTWAFSGERDWCDTGLSQGRAFLRKATQVKNIWVPYGE